MDSSSSVLWGAVSSIITSIAKQFNFPDRLAFLLPFVSAVVYGVLYVFQNTGKTWREALLQSIIVLGSSLAMYHGFSKPLNQLTAEKDEDDIEIPIPPIQAK